MAGSSDIHRLVGLEEGADPEEVKRAYQLWAAELHPNRHPDDPDAAFRFAELVQAYLRWLQERGEAPAAADRAPGAPPIDFRQLQDVFADLFGPAAGRPRRGADLKIPLPLGAGDALAGVQRGVTITRQVLCAVCRGSGSRDGALRACAGCAETGRQQQSIGGLVIATTCAECRGRGRIAVTPCGACNDGLCSREVTVTVTVPPGIEAGQVLRLLGKGNECFEGETGDCYLAVEIEAEPFAREGADAIVEVVAGICHVLLGGSIEAPAPDGRVSVRVPRGVRDRHTVRVAGRGHPRSSKRAAGGRDPYRGSGGNGDLVVVVRVPPGAAAAPRHLLAGALALLTSAAVAFWLAR